MVKCLIVDDDYKILHYVSQHLETAQIQTVTQASGESAIAYLANNKVDIAVVDIMMTGMDGFELCQLLKNDYDLPVIMLTARDALSDKERAFVSGTDDYVTKPFEVKELLFRIQAVLRRYQINSQDIIKLGNVTLIQEYMELSVDSKNVNLPTKEFQLLFLLCGQPKHIFTRDTLIERIWGFDYEGDERTIDVHIKRLRHRLNQLKATIEIQTVRGQGYRVITHV
ncbi:response regulator transcription factor [Staphylococcus haemolyticus]|uniref:response regulator transcription factor n=1 Tax=Staphylococcus TaxID=1279 RepID=UPI00069DE740|nr:MULTISPECIES: response regulator transcription factor [Staphylococcus]MBC3104769.1 response regulator transcription factor [Staphylococcus haemolyticus]MCF7610223.1 response regulator transcription factor [Staphylococcus haemolyticus]MCH4374863.1 response regulator transcription factor [Staphylococcus haemolyticus]MCH4522323.1 response regulator transcription factor [Staphylococcus haemolyticus]MCT1687846.1 response regulator transcription factor [Staphylococcus haemolyticus]